MIQKSIIKSSKAFSLIEILVVLFILAFVFTWAGQRFTNKSRAIKSTFNKLIRLNSRLILISKLHNKEYRLVLQLNEEGPEQYWVEKRQPKAIQKDQDDIESDLSSFVIDEYFYSKPQKIPSLLQITKVESSWEPEKTKGLAYIYYYPKGLAQETSLYFLRTDNKAEWTLYLDPIGKNFQIIKK